MTSSDYALWRRISRSLQRLISAVISFFICGALMIGYIFPILEVEVIVFNVNLVDILILIASFLMLFFMGQGLNPLDDIAPARYGDIPAVDGLLVGCLSAGIVFSLALGISYGMKVVELIFSKFIEFISMFSY